MTSLKKNCIEELRKVNFCDQLMHSEKQHESESYSNINSLRAAQRIIETSGLE